VLARMKLLVWTPRINLGGGAGLVKRIVPALASEPRVGQLTWASEARPDLVESLTTSSDFRRVELLSARVHQRVLARPAVQARAFRWARRHVERMVVRRVLAALQARELRALANQHDLVYVPWPHGYARPEIARPLVCTVQDTMLLDYPEILGGAAAEREARSICEWISGSAACAVSSQNTKNALVRRFGRIAMGVRVIPHAVMPRDLSSIAQAALIGPDVPARYILCLANISPHKNLDTLLIAWSRFAGRREYPLVIAGHGTEALDPRRPLAVNLNWQQDRLGGLVRRLDLQPGADIIPLGYVPDAAIVPLVRAAAALISPSLSEGGGSYPVEEALALGVPVLCSDIPVMREQLHARRRDSIVWFDPVSVESIGSALTCFARDAHKHKRAAEIAAEDARPTWANVASAYADVFEAVLANRQTNAGARL
jgi:glycosyltransferase involved in cell wall biosynthesis